jgi:hypothetical protein
VTTDTSVEPNVESDGCYLWISFAELRLLLRVVGRRKEPEYEMLADRLRLLLRQMAPFGAKSNAR